MAYHQTSPYFSTSITGNFLDVMNNRTIPKYDSDVYWEITTAYQYRPDLLAHDLYNDGRLWWVFAQRNPNTLVDPLFDFSAGTKIYLPTLETLKNSLGY